MRDGHLWVIVLAAGDGIRVAALTTDAAGTPVPKQYCSFGGRGSMLQWAVARACRLVPPARVLVVVAEHHRSHWERQLTMLPPGNIVIQPENRGTAAGVLLPFVEVFLRRDPEAHLLLLPADHFVADEPVLRHTMIEGVRGTRSAVSPVVLLGMTPEEPDPDYGWVLPSGDSQTGLRGVASFVEKPDRAAAAELVARGALINSFVIAASASAMLRLYEATIPGLLRMFLGALRGDADAARVAHLYERIPIADFSRHVLTHATKSLAVIAVPACGWSDLGTPARLARYMAASRVVARPAASIPARPSSRTPRIVA